MTEQQNTNRERLENIWLRLVFMLVFFIGHRVSSFILMIIAAIQFILVLLKSQKNERLLEFSSSLNKYIYQSGTYLSFEHDLKPFPFDNWPDSMAEEKPVNNEDPSSVIKPNVNSEPEPVAENQEKPAAVKKATRKAPVKKKATTKESTSKPKTAPKPAASKDQGSTSEGNES